MPQYSEKELITMDEKAASALSGEQYYDRTRLLLGKLANDQVKRYEAVTALHKERKS